jgi:PAS domain S-box-containing protein
METDQKKEEESLRQIKLIVENSYDAIIGETLDGTITNWNGGAERMLGYSKEEMIGKSISLLLPPEMKEEMPTLLNKVKEGQFIADYDSVMLRKDGSPINVAFSGSPIKDAGGTVIGVSVVERDITARKKVEVHIQRMIQLYAVLSQCNKAIVHSTNEDELFQQICRASVQSGGMAMVWIGLLDEEDKQIKSVSSFGIGTEYLKDTHISVKEDDPFGRGPTGTTVRENRPIWSQDFQNDPAWNERAKSFGWRASASLPLLRNDIPVGSFTLYSDILNAFDDDAQKLLVEMSKDISFALDNFAAKERSKISEESLRQTQSIVNNSYDAIIGETLDGTITSWNGGAERMFGYKAEEVIGRSILFLVPDDVKDEVSSVFKKLKEGEVIADYDSARTRRDGKRVEVSFSSSPIKTPDGTIVGVSCVERDVTNRKTEEESLRQIKLIVENSYDAIIGETLDGTITSWNGGAERMFGYAAKEIIGKSVSILLPAEMKDEMPTLLNKVKQGQFIADYDSVMLKKDGSRIDVAFSGSPIKDSDGTIVGASVVERDITVRKQGELHIKELNEIRNKFIAIVSHQLGTPLTSINWNLEQVLDGDFGKLEDVTHKFLQATHKASTEIAHRIHALLMAMDIEEGRVAYKKEETSLDSMTASITNEMPKKCELKNISFQYIAPEKDLPLIEIDGEKMREVINVLTENALNYTDDNGKIVAKLWANDTDIHFEIRDTGIGIPMQEQHRIFTRFFRASNASIMQQDAFGLGLSIAKSFVEQHGGKIGFESKEKEGSMFWFEIPLKNKKI